MDDCGEYEIFPGINRDDLVSYEDKKILVNNLEENCQSWTFNGNLNTWKLLGLTTDYFNGIYSPYIYHNNEPGELYERKFTNNYVEMIDPYCSLLLRMNTQFLNAGKKASILLTVVEEQNNELSINFKYGVGQFLPTVVIGKDNKLYIKQYPGKQSVFDEQTVGEAYDGNVQEWKNKYSLQQAQCKCIKKDWSIVEVNKLLGDKHTCVSTIDVLNRLLLIIDLCGNINFYMWLGSCVEMWHNWPEVSCDSITIAHIRNLEKNEKNFNFETMLKQFRILGDSNGFKRHNLYLGCDNNLVSELAPFATTVSNGIFTLKGE